MNMLIANIFGWTGLILMVLAYYLLATKRFEQFSFSYNFMNFIAGIFVLINSFAFKIWAVFVLNVFWAAIALFGMIKSKQQRGVKKK